MNLKTVENYIKDHLYDLLSSMFGKIDFKNRFTVERELDVWLPDTKDLWEVKRGLRAETYSIYFDNEIICNFSEEDHPIEVDKKFLSGFLEAYQRERIFLNKEFYVAREEKEKQEKIIKEAAKKAQRDKDFKHLSADEREIAEIVVKEVEKDKGHATTK